MTTGQADRIIRVFILIDAALIVGSLLLAARTGHLPGFVIMWAVGSLAAALVYVRSRHL